MDRNCRPFQQASSLPAVDEVAFGDKEDHPIGRLRNYLVSRSWWSEAEEKAWKKVRAPSDLLPTGIIPSSIEGVKF